MARPLKLEIKESKEELKKLLGKQRTGQGKERVQAIYLLKCDHVKTITVLAERLGRHRGNATKVVSPLSPRRNGGLIAGI